MRFVIDAQLPPALARRLRSRGHQAEHVSEIGLVGAPDSHIWAHAAATRAIIISKDEDFAKRVWEAPADVQVIWIRLGNATNASLWSALEPLWAEIVQALEAGERLIEIA